MDRILPIGTVVEARGLQLLLLGAIMMEQDGKMVPAYHAVKYPLGFAGEESLGQLGAAEITKVLAEGHEDRTARRYNESLAVLYKEATGLPPAEARAVLDKAYEDWHKAMERISAQ